MQLCGSVRAKGSIFLCSSSEHSWSSSTRQEASCMEYILNIYIFFKMLQTLKVHFRNIARKFHDTFYSSYSWGEHSRVFHARRKTTKKKAAFKIKSQGFDMRSTWNMRQAAGTFTWGGQRLRQRSRWPSSEITAVGCARFTTSPPLIQRPSKLWEYREFQRQS